jgi:hypothetical protein
MEAAAITSEACQTSRSDEALTRQIAFPFQQPEQSIARMAQRIIFRGNGRRRQTLREL